MPWARHQTNVPPYIEAEWGTIRSVSSPAGSATGSSNSRSISREFRSFVHEGQTLGLADGELPSAGMGS